MSPGVAGLTKDSEEDRTQWEEEQGNHYKGRSCPRCEQDARMHKRPPAGSEPIGCWAQP